MMRDGGDDGRTTSDALNTPDYMEVDVTPGTGYYQREQAKRKATGPPRDVRQTTEQELNEKHSFLAYPLNTTGNAIYNHAGGVAASSLKLAGDLVGLGKNGSITHSVRGVTSVGKEMANTLVEDDLGRRTISADGDRQMTPCESKNSFYQAMDDVSDAAQSKVDSLGNFLTGAGTAIRNSMMNSRKGVEPANPFPNAEPLANGGAQVGTPPEEKFVEEREEQQPEGSEDLGGYDYEETPSGAPSEAPTPQDPPQDPT